MLRDGRGGRRSDEVGFRYGDGDEPSRLRPADEGGAPPLSLSSLRYGAYGLYSRARRVGEGVAAGVSGEVALTRLPSTIRAAARSPTKEAGGGGDDERLL